MDYIGCNAVVQHSTCTGNDPNYDVRDASGTELYPLETVVRTPPTVQARVRQENGSEGGADHHGGPPQGVAAASKASPVNTFSTVISGGEVTFVLVAVQVGSDAATIPPSSTAPERHGDTVNNYYARQTL